MDYKTKNKLLELFGTTNLTAIKKQLKETDRVIQNLDDAIAEAEKQQNNSNFT